MDFIWLRTVLSVITRHLEIYGEPYPRARNMNTSVSRGQARSKRRLFEARAPLRVCRHRAGFSAVWGRRAAEARLDVACFSGRPRFPVGLPARIAGSAAARLQTRVADDWVGGQQHCDEIEGEEYRHRDIDDVGERRHEDAEQRRRGREEFETAEGDDRVQPAPSDNG